MNQTAQFRWTDVLWFVLMVALGLVTRGWYLSQCLVNGTAENLPFVAQQESPRARVAPGTGGLDPKNTTELDYLVHNLRDEERWFGGTTPLSDKEENTAHVSPGYPWMLYVLTMLADQGVVEEDSLVPTLRLVQCILGALTAGLYFLFARIAFRSLAVALVTGVLCAVHPFWVVNIGEMGDGVLASFLLAVCLVSGTRASQSAGAGVSLLYGLSLAGAALVRAAMLPFVFVGLLWFLVRCRNMQRGWLCGVLAVLGFANGVALWTVRNYQNYGEIVPIVNTAYVHLWMGNNPLATGSTLSEADLRASLPADRLQEIMAEPNQHHRYTMLGEDTVDYITTQPTKTVRNRITTALYFFLGPGFFNGLDVRPNFGAGQPTPEWLVTHYELIVTSVLLGMLLLGVLGWRWSYAWSHYSGGLAALAVVWITLPYMLSHVEPLWGPRLPLDGILLAYSAVALVSIATGFRSMASRGPQPA
jgi:4-amino-4-deoxy-L-arabinose transferase-like glycosyltransferase